MLDFPISELPSPLQLAQAKESLAQSEQTLRDITQRIEDTENELAELIASSKRNIDGMKMERTALQKQIAFTLGYISPIRRLPSEILRVIFLMYFDQDPCCAWNLSAACRLWRRVTLGMPRIWSKIRLETTQGDSADTIRLWLERSGNTCPLDIEITLQVGSPPANPVKAFRRGRSHSYSHSPPLLSPPMSWTTGIPIHHPGTLNLVPTASGLVQYIPPALLPSPTPVIPCPPGSQVQSPAPNMRTIMHWGHIAIYYLTQRMERWERFVFKFDKAFPSVNALRSICSA